MVAETLKIIENDRVLNPIFANEGNCGKRLVHLFITSSSSHYFDKTDF